MKKIIALLLWLGAAGSAAAQSCSVTPTGLAFGSYSPGTSSPASANATVSVTCQAAVSLLVSYTVTLSTGGGGSFSARSMAGPASPRLSYQIYDNMALTQIWGDGSGGTSYVTDGYLLQVLTPVTRNYTAYGAIPAGQQAAPGSFTDTITVLLTY